MGYIGAVIGAGFASGQEIVRFFLLYGSWGFKGTIVALFLFAVLGGILLFVAHYEGVSSYQDVLSHLMGVKLARIIDFLIAVFLFLGISTMLSASGAVFAEHLYLSKYMGIFLVYILLFFFLFLGKKGLVLSYNILVPIKIILLLVITLYVNSSFEGSQLQEYSRLQENINMWLIASILYVAYNFTLALVVLSEYQSLTDKRGGIIGGIMGGLLLGILVVLSFIALSKFIPAVLHYEVPMLYVAGNISLPAKYLYTVVLWLGIITTALANTYGFTQRIFNYTGLNYKFVLLASLTLAIPIATQDFSVLVAKIYPLFGLLGLIIILALIKKAIKDIARELYYNIKQ